MDTSKEKYLPGNVELLTMFQSKSFDKVAATTLLVDIADLNQPILDLNGYETTYLFEAETYNNVEAVRFLLENGADPNYNNLDLINGCALVDLHFLWEEMQEEATQRLEIAKLFFEYGGNPDLWYETETLYDHVLWEVFMIEHTPHRFYREYFFRFFTLLIAYGGGQGKSNNMKPQLTELIDKNRIDKYEFKLFKCEDGYHLEGHLFNPDGVHIGTI